MQTTSPIVDCGVHYVDVMCQITDARPVEVRGMGLRLTDEIAPVHVQLRPSAGAVRRRLGRLVRGRLGADDFGDRLLREGRDLAERLRVDRHEGGRQIRRHRHPHQDFDHPPAQRCNRRGRQVRQAGRDAVDGGRARPPGSLRSRTGFRAEGDPRGYRSDPPHGRRGEVARRLPCRRRERAQRRAPSNSRTGTTPWAR